MFTLLNRITFLILTIAYMALIWLQTSHFNPESVSSLSSQISKGIILLIGICLEMAHLFEFGFLYMFIILVILSFGRLTFKKEVVAAVIAISYGVVDEIHQLFVPFRSTSIGDLLKNTIGVLVIWWVIHKYYFQEKNSKIGRILRKINGSSHTL